MKRLGSMALFTLLASSFTLLGCETSSRLDKTVQIAEHKDEPAVAPVKADHSGSLEERVARLEESQARSAEALEWLTKWYAQQQQQQQTQADRQQREELDPDGVFAVDIAADLKLGQVEGPAQALVTIVEAWDFA